MFPSNLVAYIEDNNIVINNIIVVAAYQDSSDASMHPRICVEDGDPPLLPPPFETGISITTTLDKLTPAAVCPLFTLPDSAATRCAAGNDQILGDGRGNLLPTGGSLLDGSAQTDTVMSYRGFDFYSPDNDATWKLYIASQRSVGAGTFANEIVRYDYALTGNPVLSNPVVIASDTVFDSQSDLFYSVAQMGDLIYVTQDLAAGPDIIRVFEPDGNELDALFSIDTVRAGSDDIRDIRQIVPFFDEYLSVVNFSSFTAAVRVIDPVTPGTLIKSYALTDQLRGVQPLFNGDFLIAGQQDIDRTIVNTFIGETRRVPEGSPRTAFNRQGHQIGRACLP
jgi:hypothetical protein